MFVKIWGPRFEITCCTFTWIVLPLIVVVLNSYCENRSEFFTRSSWLLKILKFYLLFASYYWKLLIVAASTRCSISQYFLLVAVADEQLSSIRSAKYSQRLKNSLKNYKNVSFFVLPIEALLYSRIGGFVTFQMHYHKCCRENSEFDFLSHTGERKVSQTRCLSYIEAHFEAFWSSSPRGAYFRHFNTHPISSR